MEIQNIIPPHDIKNVMEKQIKSERTRRAAVLRADGDRMHDVITSRGDVAQVYYGNGVHCVESVDCRGYPCIYHFARKGSSCCKIDGCGGREEVN